MVEKENFSENKFNKDVKNVYEIYTDGASRGNPGDSGIGFLIKKNGKDFIKKSFYIGIVTNNFSEYFALITAVCFLSEFLSGKEIINVYSDSLLLIKQLNNEYSVKNILLKKSKIFLDFFFKNKNVFFFHIPREKNKIADLLANKGIDEKISLPSHMCDIFNKINSNNSN